jgi:hypothetical protein
MIFTINRERNEGKLQALADPITPQEIRRVGNHIVD